MPQNVSEGEHRVVSENKEPYVTAITLDGSFYISCLAHKLLGVPCFSSRQVRGVAQGTVQNAARASALFSQTLPDLFC